MKVWVDFGQSACGLLNSTNNAPTDVLMKYKFLLKNTLGCNVVYHIWPIYSWVNIYTAKCFWKYVAGCLLSFT